MTREEAPRASHTAMELTKLEWVEPSRLYRTKPLRLSGYAFGPLVLADGFALLLTTLAVLAGVLGAWCFAADPGWTNSFFITNGLFSHYQMWMAVAIGAQTSSRALHRWASGSHG